MLDALVVAPHPDDAELGMGGTIVRLMHQGWKVGILDLTSGEPTPLGSVERRTAETAPLTPPWAVPGGKISAFPIEVSSRRYFTAARSRPFSVRCGPGCCSLPTGKMRTPTTRLQQSWLRMRDFGAN